THKGSLGEVGSVGWMFEHVSLIEGLKPAAMKDPEEEAIEAGANEVADHGEGLFAFYGAPSDLDQIRTALTGRGWTIKTAELSYKAKNLTELNEEQHREVTEFLHELDDNDDTFRIHTTLD